MGAVINEGMSLCNCMCCQREGPSERKQSFKKTGGGLGGEGGVRRGAPGSCSAPGLSPGMQPGAGNSCRGFAGQKGRAGTRGYTYCTRSHTLPHPRLQTHALSSFPRGQEAEELHLTFAFCQVCFGISAAFQSKQRQRIYGKRKILNLDERGTRKAF